MAHPARTQLRAQFGLATERAEALFRAKEVEVHRGADRIFFWLLLVQWTFAVAVGLVTGHELLRAALAGGLLALLPIGAILCLPASPLTRGCVALAQVAWSDLLPELATGPFEAPSLMFVSLAFLAFYRDWRILVLALLASLGASLQGGLQGEHLLLTVEGLLLADGCVRGSRELRAMALREASLQHLSETIEEQVDAQTAALEASTERYRALVEGSHAVPWELDPVAFEFTYLSPQAAHLTGVDPGTSRMGRALWRIVHKDDRGRVLRALVELAQADNPGTLDFECRMNTVSGNPIHVRSRVSRSPLGLLLGTSFDVTRHKKLELELHQAQKLESVGRLAAGVAHEINTPVQFVGDSLHFVREAMPDLQDLLERYQELGRAVKGGSVPGDLVQRIEHAEQLADLPYLLEQVPKALDRSLDGLGRVVTIVKSMGAFARSDRIEMSQVDLNRAIQSTLVIARNEYKYVADVNTEFGTLPLVTCHGGDINQVILNLVINAAHAIAAKRERGKIDIRTCQHGDEVLIAISDTGTGIPPEIRDRIFEPFFTTKPVGQGTGQGLAIARSVVTERHGGQLEFTTRMGVGTTFTIRLPVSPPRRAAA